MIRSYGTFYDNICYHCTIWNDFIYDGIHFFCSTDWCQSALADYIWERDRVDINKERVNKNLKAFDDPRQLFLDMPDINDEDVF